MLAAAVLAGIVCYAVASSLSQVASLLGGVGTLSKRSYRTAEPGPSVTVPLPATTEAASVQDTELAGTGSSHAHEPHLAQSLEPPLDESHLPAEPATRPFERDPTALRARLESLLESDPEALGQARALLDEPDANLRARNLELLHETFGVE